MEKKFVLKGLDDYNVVELKKYWQGWDPKKDEPKILGLGLSCSFLCNYKCNYCYVGEKRPGADELTLGEQLNLIDQAVDLGAKTVIICGDGDPLMDKNLCYMTEHAYKKGMTSVVVTNSAVMGDDKLAMKIHNKTGREVAQALYNSGCSLVVKMDTLNPELYEKIVNVSGSFEKFKKAIKHIIDIGFTKENYIKEVSVTRLGFSAVVMKQTYDEVPEMKRYADTIGAQFICKVPSLVGNALNNLDQMFHVNDYEKVRKYLKQYTAKRETLMVDIPRCMAWHYGPVIDIRGEVRECYTSPCSQEKRIGNIRKDSLRELMKKRNQIYDVTKQDYCPVKSRINEEFLTKGFEKVWNIAEEKACIDYILDSEE
ncbi:radical SAM protein [Desulfosporosinus sp. PR]|uniref:radical SAM protein n=1 Tax=Candidatus Desulfosporosinus nitrosoreducens TaxID=3401928 RepID=UPI0027F0F1C5|nr:radical SAM protein [Desulfosporosinus sp. PR]MDQ7094871.1 radical SAM protein [Desulfosporosinus sp. PR]